MLWQDLEALRLGPSAMFNHSRLQDATNQGIQGYKRATLTIQNSKWTIAPDEEDQRNLKQMLRYAEAHQGRNPLQGQARNKGGAK
eukprot:3040631-Amphidinium_carterae.2